MNRVWGEFWCHTALTSKKNDVVVTTGGWIARLVHFTKSGKAGGQAIRVLLLHVNPAKDVAVVSQSARYSYFCHVVLTWRCNSETAAASPWRFTVSIKWSARCWRASYSFGQCRNQAQLHTIRIKIPLLEQPNLWHQ
jgi:hypothetical protein